MTSAAYLIASLLIFAAAVAAFSTWRRRVDGPVLSVAALLGSGRMRTPANDHRAMTAMAAPAPQERSAATASTAISADAARSGASAARSLREAIESVTERRRQTESKRIAAHIGPVETPEEDTIEWIKLPRSTFDMMLADRRSAGAWRRMFDEGPVMPLAFTSQAPYRLREAPSSLARARGGDVESELLGHPLAELFDPDDSARVMRLASDADGATAAVRLCADDGTPMPCRLQIAAADPLEVGLRRALLVLPTERAAEQVAEAQSAPKLQAVRRVVQLTHDLAERLAGVHDDHDARRLIGAAAMQILPGWTAALVLSDAYDGLHRPVAEGAAKRAAGKRLVRVPFESREHAIRGELLLRGNQPVDGDESALAEELGQLFTGAIKGLWAHRRARLPVFGSPSLDTVPSLYSRG